MDETKSRIVISLEVEFQIVRLLVIKIEHQITIVLEKKMRSRNLLIPKFSNIVGRSRITSKNVDSESAKEGERS